MKKIISICLLIVIILTLNGCSTKKDGILPDSTKNIIKITVDAQPGGDSSLKSTDDKEKITEIYDYLKALDLKKTTDDAGRYTGMSYIITLYFDDDTCREYIHFGNKFFKELGKEWYEMTYVQAERFEDIYNSLPCEFK